MSKRAYRGSLNCVPRWSGVSGSPLDICTADDSVGALAALARPTLIVQVPPERGLRERILSAGLLVVVL